MRNLRRKQEAGNRGKPMFMYSSSHGSSGYQPYRLKQVKAPVDSHTLIEHLDAILAKKSELTLRDGQGGIFTVGLFLSQSGLFIPYKYGIVFEIPKRDIYAVFYVTANGQVKWIAGPKVYNFSVVWERLLLLSKDTLH